MQDTKPLWSAVQTGCREAGVEVMYTVMQSLTQDGRDRSLDYKISGFFYATPHGGFKRHPAPA